MDGPQVSDSTATGSMIMRTISHYEILAPLVAVADVHVFDEAHRDVGAAEALDQRDRAFVVDAALDYRVDLDRPESGGTRGLDAVENVADAAETAVHPREDGCHGERRLRELQRALHRAR